MVTLHRRCLSDVPLCFSIKLRSKRHTAVITSHNYDLVEHERNAKFIVYYIYDLAITKAIVIKKFKMQGNSGVKQFLMGLIVILLLRIVLNTNCLVKGVIH